ncbi:hypothetical protein I6N90_17560 [Paenibacillus sp. GSMTC-2017]|uniref:hypothetical protein n=1 Tax=Paenibacillus sp. GSMTC-2017 TaxID=2794350 RepID=UPI0018D7E9B3|nr:hypothetical protein [Paenibacillus sp. GSMTC-2017]MBH5319607.1 hypothetical protein [Paenibacillus sp. GSMTC-2017]
MNRRWLFLLYICLVFVLSACGKYTNNPLPKSSAYVGETDITVPVEIFSSYWAGQYDYGDTNAYEHFKTHTIVPPNSKIRISFDREPEKIVKVSEVINLEESKEVESIGNEINIPYISGIHTYTYSAEWPEGIVTFVFSVEVK